MERNFDSLERIEKRIEALSDELQQHTTELNALERRKNELVTNIVSKNGALIELRKLSKKEIK